MKDQRVVQMETVIECVDVDAMLAFFVDDVDFRLELVSPADDPSEYVVAGHGARVRLVRGDTDRPVRLRLSTPRDSDDGHDQLLAPNGTVVELVSPLEAVAMPEPVATLSVVSADGDGGFGTGRAGMGYRDLLPDRWGGSFIASHILIADGGDVADYVHFHRIRFQMIFVAAGWVDVVYEGQGEEFRMHAGDCVVQPPGIRHRVLRSSPGLEVIEIGCPAVHDTLVEHDISLPTPTLEPDRDFSGQRFVRHVATASTPDPSRPGADAFVHRNTGIDAATNGLADVRVLTMPSPDARSGAACTRLTHDGEFAMYVVLTGSATLVVSTQSEQRDVVVTSRDAVALPPGATWSWSARSSDFELLQVVLPSGCVRVMEADHAE